MAYKMLVKSVSGHLEHRKIALGLLTGFLLSLTFLSPSIYTSFPFPSVNIRSSSSTNGTPMIPTISNSAMRSLSLEAESASHESKPECDGCKKDIFIGMNGNSSAKDERMGINNTHLPLANNLEVISKLDKPMPDQPEMVSTISIVSTITNALTEIKVSDKPFQSENNTKMDDENTISDELKSETVQIDDLSTSSTTSGSTLEEVTSKSDQLDENGEEVKPKDTKIKCDFSNRRSNRCEMDGDIRIHGKSSSVVFMTKSDSESRKIKPYARKTDTTAMSGVREITISPSNGHDNPLPACTVNHSIPVLVFSIAGYTGNFFHDFTDVLVPLFQTSFQFQGEVQFLIADFRSWWTNKYLPIFNQLSKYQLIDLDNDDRVHCFPRALVGLDSDDDLQIDTSRNQYSTQDFSEMLRKAYSLPRRSPLTMRKHSRSNKPRLLIVARSHTRKFTNTESIVKMAERIGYEVVVAEAESDVAHFARVVNSCDVMMGVHGAGLTNFVFLPTNAVLIQVVPWGDLDWIASNYFEKPSKGMNLRYLEYRIVEEESTLRELYPSDDPVFKDPSSVHKLGWTAMGEIYLVKQNVRLDVKRFRPVLVKALRLLRKKYVVDN